MAKTTTCFAAHVLCVVFSVDIGLMVTLPYDVISAVLCSRSGQGHVKRQIFKLIFWDIKAYASMADFFCGIKMRHKFLYVL